jgi:hypothetical protein
VLFLCVRSVAGAAGTASGDVLRAMVLADWDDVRPLWNEGDRGVLVLHHACMDVLVHVIDHVYTRQRLFGLVQSLHGRAGQGQSHPMRFCARVPARARARPCESCIAVNITAQAHPLKHSTSHGKGS